MPLVVYAVMCYGVRHHLHHLHFLLALQVHHGILGILPHPVAVPSTRTSCYKFCTSVSVCCAAAVAAMLLVSIAELVLVWIVVFDVVIACFVVVVLVVVVRSKWLGGPRRLEWVVPGGALWCAWCVAVVGRV